MKKTFLEAIAEGGLVGDGAMGSLLYERGIYINRNFDEINLQDPDLVSKIHHEYLEAGAHIIETNTYGANTIRLERHALAEKMQAINLAAVQIARRTVGESAYICGSMGPTGLSAEELKAQEAEVRMAFEAQARALCDGGADAVLIETVAQPHELRMAIEGARAGSTLPIVAQVKAVKEGVIIDGSDPLELAKEMHQWGADVVGANCNGPEEIFRVVSRMVESGLPVSAFANAGRARNVEDREIYLATPEHLGVYARRMYKAGVKLVGGCCGTNPQHIRRVAAAARMVVPRSSVLRELPSTHIKLRERTPVHQRSALGKKLGQKLIFSVEINPDKGLSTKAPIAAAKMLKEAGADVINIADGPRASVRMGNLALALEMQKAVDIDVLLHFVTRDKNLLGLQASILGAHVLGMRNLVVVTGDPPKLGDYPDATAVYDVDSVGLLKLIDGLNRGVDPAGRAFEPPTSFVLATGCEPAAKDWERERLRLAQKVEAGADFVMTQPVFDEKILARFLDEAERLNIPVLLGLIPLASHKNAEFLHKEVPGMQLPDTIREQMRKAGKGKDARQVGVELALQSLSKVRSRVAGAYIMPPLGHYEMAAEIIKKI